jgi:hypothetical protein
MMRRMRHIAAVSRLLAAAMLVSLALVLPVRGDDASSLEYRVKAVCLYNFAKYVKWPDSAFSTAEAPLKLCILGSNPFGELFNDANGKQAQNRTLQVEFMSQAKSTADLAGCHILFWSAPDHDRYKKIIEPLASSPTLTVSETTGAGIVNFFIEDGKVRFEISLAKAKRAMLVISSQLLKLARVIDEKD